MTNGFFGLLRAYIIIALFGARPAVAGYSIGDAITYTGLAQALIAYIALWGWWDLIRSIRTGEVASDLSRPLDYYGYWCAQDCGRAAAQLLVRGLPIMVLYAIFFHISLPPTLHHWLALLTSLGLALLVSFSGALLVYYPALFFLGQARLARPAALHAVPRAARGLRGVGCGLCFLELRSAEVPLDGDVTQRPTIGGRLRKPGTHNARMAHMGI